MSTNVTILLPLMSIRSTKCKPLLPASP